MRLSIFLPAYIVLIALIEKILKNKLDIRDPKGLFNHFNKLHKWLEVLLIAGIILSLFINALYTFILFILLFAFRALMEWKFDKDSKLYILNVLYSGEFLLLLIILLLFFERESYVI
ncbi:DUF4181 domain-containing protein [Alkaliphilus sp. MSJ-5]|uniref:DUF4181 domain-containing protein n=1 Tax=Alkaliphilus flagellatus TaxID=2841507 RepID=A0ABS6G5I8_9FIRM|nr:DUF4181 domain-containing protein [Alkaliphilus flagellatus]MBU5677755.1 DUF4181 domain-containing protein [Alkaliphilus flagellatus]